MKSTQDALYNWLSIKMVSEARPDDVAARETFELFDAILVEEYQIHNVVIEKREDMYFVTYDKDEQSKSTRFPIDLIDCFLDGMKEEPEKFVNYE